MTGERATDRVVLAVTGADRVKFLQGLVTNDVARLEKGAVYAAMLTPQGKYLADFLIVGQGERILLDVAAILADGLLQRLSMYKLRADVQIARTDVSVLRGLGDAPHGAVPDPRDGALGWRLYGTGNGEAGGIDWDAVRVAQAIPETGIELIPNETFILEVGFERLHGVDFRKGCYVGQEVTARMKHKTELRKGLAQVTLDGQVPVGTEITSGERVVGKVFTQSGGQALAHLRFDWADGEMRAGDAKVNYLAPAKTS